MIRVINLQGRAVHIKRSKARPQRQLLSPDKIVQPKKPDVIIFKAKIWTFICDINQLQNFYTKNLLLT